ncbi:Plasmodium vivax Vir protein, putative [Plasmodium vivax]|uniref:VIR protein n=1 Tax=Plasmodium vivax TaxID=5855 RepID=A0A1G4GSG3_PLAVI|nr:Plasmodium vivax Vir protein, putative [Plasmodium vivax]SCO65530.1 VIR protein [Plasmodium vivax]
MGEHLTEEHLKKLTSYYKYSKFEDGENGCNGISFYSNIKEELQNQNYQYYGLPKISDNILRALCYIYNKKKNYKDKFEEELCSYLFYWLGDKIYPKVKNQTVFSRIINMIFQELNTSHTENIMICKYPNSSIELDTFIQNKLLFDYSKDYKNIEMVTAPGTTTCDKVYKDYIKKYKDIYIDAYSNCRGKNDKKYECDKYEEIFNENLYTKLSSFSCRYSENGTAVLESQREPEELKIELTQDLSLTREGRSSAQRIALRNASLDSHHRSDGQEGQRRIESPLIGDTSENSSSKTIAGSVAPVLGVSSFSLLLYKVTPLGGYINRLLGRNSNMYNNIDYMDSFNPYSDGIVPGDRRMNISYHRL